MVWCLVKESAQFFPPPSDLYNFPVEMHEKLWFGKLKRKDLLKDVRIYWRLILKVIANKFITRV
jgi:hypothetical protein